MCSDAATDVPCSLTPSSSRDALASVLYLDVETLFPRFGLPMPLAACLPPAAPSG